MEPKIWLANEKKKKNHTFADDVRIDYFPYCIVHKYEELTILFFSGSLSKICCTKLDLLQDIQNFMGSYLMCTCF